MRKLKYFLLLAGAMLATLSGAATLAPIQLLNPAGSTAGQAIVSTGPSSAPGWGSPSTLAPVAANTIIGNFTAGTLAPSANAVPSCSTANSALKYTSGTGLSCGTTFALTSGNLSQFAATTSAQLAGVLSDETGSTGGVAVFSASPTFTGTAAFAALSATGTITPSQTNGIVGTTTNNNANAGSFGEYVSSNVASGSAVALTTSVAANVTSISLTAGDWMVCGNVFYAPAGGTAVTQAAAVISTTSAALPTAPNGGGTTLLPVTFTTGQAIGVPTGCMRQLLASTTTVYLVALSAFTGGTNGAYGFIGARRVR